MTSGGVVCPDESPVEFTCIAVGVNRLEWQINGQLIGSRFSAYDSPGRRITVGSYTLFLDMISPFTAAGVNMTSRLVVSLSNLRRGDLIACSSLSRLETQSTGPIDYLLRGIRSIVNPQHCSELKYTMY